MFGFDPLNPLILSPEIPFNHISNHGCFARTLDVILQPFSCLPQSVRDKMASAANHNNIYLSLRCQVTHASGVTAFGCGRS